MEYIIKPMDTTQVSEICKWRYEVPYSIYNMDDDGDEIEELLNGSYFSVLDGENKLIGFYCFGESAQVPAGKQFGAYEPTEVLDIGLGIRPDLCGEGLGYRFLQQGMLFAEKQFSVKSFRLTVAAFNQRAIKVYERVGFRKVRFFERTSETGKIVFDVMMY